MMIARPIHPLSKACLVKATTVFLSVGILSGCSGWFGGDNEKRLPGAREEVLRSGQTLATTAEVSGTPINLPSPVRNTTWPGYGGAPSHAMQHLEVAENLKRVWQADIGSGSGGDEQQLATPVIADGKVFVLDADNLVTALDAKSGRQLWQFNLVPSGESSGAHSGGIAIAGGRVVAATGYGEVVAITAANGKLAWRRRVGPPFRAAPTISRGRIVAVSHDNRTYALDLRDGKPLWRHQGQIANAGLVGGGSPAVGGGLVVVPYSNGEVYGLSLDTGRELFGDALVKARDLTPLSSLSAVRAAPVFDRNVIFAVSHAGTMVALDLQQRRRLWSKEIAGTEMPWVAGNFVYVLNTKNELLCLTRNEGRVRWVLQLDRFGNPEDSEDPIFWSGPVLASDRLYLTSDAGQFVTVSPSDGKILSRTELPGGASVPPVVADGTVYFLSDDGVLIAYR